MGRKKIVDNDSRYQTCCVCTQKTSRYVTQITQIYKKKQKGINSENETLTIFDILENLQLIRHEVKNVETTVICSNCRKIVLDFYDFKVMTESKQSQNNLPAKNIESSTDTIRKYLGVNHYNKLKNYIIKNVIDSMEVDDSNILTIKPAMKIKYEQDEDIPNLHFIDTNVIIKEEKCEIPELTFCNDVQLSDVSESRESNSLKHEDGSDDENELDTTQEDAFETEEVAENEEGITKTVIDNVTFVSRIPECLVNLEQKRKEAVEAEKTRFKNPENWLRIKHREARVRGQSYVNSSGKLIAAKKMKKPCNCRFQCSERVTEEDRRRNFENHWGLADFALQKKFLFEHRKTKPVERRRARFEGGRPRDHTSKYYLDTYNKDGTHKSLEHVCEVMFCNTFDISKNNLSTLHKKVITGKVQDMRGINKRKQTPGNLKAIEFVKQFPFFHIEQQMTIRQIYKNYVQECNEQKIEGIVKENTFRTIFSIYNESEFLKPNRLKEKCDICYAYDKANDADKVHLQVDFDYHIKTTVKCRNRRRWKKNKKAKVERMRIQREQMKLAVQKQQNQEPMEAIEQEVLDEYQDEMIYY